MDIARKYWVFALSGGFYSMRTCFYDYKVIYTEERLIPNTLLFFHCQIGGLDSVLYGGIIFNEPVSCSSVLKLLSSSSLNEPASEIKLSVVASRDEVSHYLDSLPSVGVDEKCLYKKSNINK